MTQTSSSGLREASVEPVAVRGRFLARNAVLNFIGQAAPLLVGVLAIPFVVRGLGTERFGLLALTWVVLGYLTAFDLGLGRATTRFVTQALAENRSDRIAPIAWTAALVQTGFGILGGLLLALLTPTLVERLLNIPPELIEEARRSFYWLSLSVPFVLITTSFRGVLEAAHRFDLVNIVRAPFTAALFLLPWLGVSLGWTLPGIVALLVVARLLALLAHYGFCVRVFPSLRGLPQFNRRELTALVGFGGWVTVSTAVGPLLLYLDRFVIGILLTLGAVAYYSAPYEIITRLWILPASLAAVLFPAFSALTRESGGEHLEALVARSTKYVLFLLGAPVVAVIASARDVLELWLGAQFAQNSALALQILSVGVLVTSLAFVPQSLLQAVGRPDLPAKFHLLQLLLHAFLVWVLVQAWGIAGAALAWTLRGALDVLMLFAAAFRLGLVPVRALLSNRLPETAALVVLGGVLAGGLSAALPVPWARLTLAAVVLLALLAGTWRFLMTEDERRQLLGVLRPAEK